MNLLRIGASRWSVFVTKDLIEFFRDWGRAKQPKVNMLSLLTRSVPEDGPQEDNHIVCKPLRGSDGMFYFRKGKKHGEKVRVFWFYGDAAKRQVICVMGCVKTQRNLDPEAINIALAIRGIYWTAVENGKLIIEEGAHLLRRK